MSHDLMVCLALDLQVKGLVVQGLNPDMLIVLSVVGMERFYFWRPATRVLGWVMVEGDDKLVR